jgi:hypothetical protein
LDSSGPHLNPPSASVDPSKSVDEDTKIAGGAKFGVGVEVGINFSQVGRAWDETAQSLSDLGAYIEDKYMPGSSPPQATSGIPGMSDPTHPY